MLNIQTRFPRWLHVVKVVTLLGDDERVTRNAFQKHGAEDAWSWATAQRPAGTPGGPRVGTAPWRVFAEGQRARDVRPLLALWLSSEELWPITLDDLASLALSDAEVRERCLLAERLAALLLHQPHSWAWLSASVGLLNPEHVDPLLDDVDDLLGDLHGRPLRTPRKSGTAVSAATPRPNLVPPAPAARPSPGPTPPALSTRPRLFRSGDRSNSPPL